MAKPQKGSSNVSGNFPPPGTRMQSSRSSPGRHARRRGAYLCAGAAKRLHHQLSGLCGVVVRKEQLPQSGLAVFPVTQADPRRTVQLKLPEPAAVELAVGLLEL